MAKATTSKSVMLSVRVPMALHDALQERLAATPPPATLAVTVVNLLWHGLERRAEATTIEEAMVAKDKEIATLRKALATAKAARPAKGSVVITATIDGETRPVLTGRKAKPVTSETAGKIILDLQEQVSALERRPKDSAVPVLHRQIKGLEDLVDAQAKKIARLQAAPVAGSGRSHPAINPKASHPAGPVLASAVPDVAGEAIGYNPKRGKRHE